MPCRRVPLLGEVVTCWCRAMPFSTAPYLSLEPGVAAEARSKRLRSTVRRTRARSEREGLDHRIVVTSGPALDGVLDTLERLHRIRWPHGSNFAHELPHLRPVLHAGAAAGAVGVHELAAGGCVVASMLVLDLHDRRCYYQSGRRVDRDARAAGTLLMQLVIDDAQRHGMREFDFLRGAEPYKSDWTGTERQLQRIFAGQGATGRVAASGLAGFERSKPALRATRRWWHRLGQRLAAAAGRAAG